LPKESSDKSKPTRFEISDASADRATSIHVRCRQAVARDSWRFVTPFSPIKIVQR
jgi:hypothetical protein